MLDVAPGDYTYSIVGTLVRYGFSSSVDFTVRALPCVTELNIKQMYLNSMHRLWSEAPVTQSVADQLMNNVVKQTPNCQY